VDALILRHRCFKIDGCAYCQRHKCSPRSAVSGYIKLMPIFVGVGWMGWSQNESAVVDNAHFLFRSLYLPYEFPHWLYMS